MLRIEDFLKVFGKWKVEITSPDGQRKEVEIEKLYNLSKQGNGIKYIEDEVDFNRETL